MPDIPPEELRAMAASIDADLEPRIRVDLDLSAEAAQRVRDVLTSVAAEVFQHAGIEGTWPLYRLLAALESAA